MPIDVGESEMDKLKIEYFKTDELIPYANNPRNNDEAVDYVANSIKEFGFKVPCVIDNEKNVVCGHTRLKAAKKLGIKEVPCIIADDLTEEQIDAFRLADNKTAEIATWDFEKLEIELESISGIDMSEFGFDIDLDEEEPTEIVEDEVPEEVETKAKLGDLWILGSHRLVCGDSTDPTVIDRLMDGVKAKLLLTDPPYGIKKDKGIKTTYGTNAHNSYKYEGEWDSDTIDKDVFDYLRKITTTQIIFGANYFSDKLPVGTSWIVWDKVGDIKFNNPFSDCELAWTNLDRVITKKYTFIQQGFVADEKEKRVHPTQKPVGMLADILKDFSEENDSILDCFGGSGSTLIACEQLNRKCYMCELDERYVSVILQRYINFKGSDEDVFLLKDGKKIPYSEVE